MQPCNNVWVWRGGQCSGLAGCSRAQQFVSATVSYVSLQRNTLGLETKRKRLNFDQV